MWLATSTWCRSAFPWKLILHHLFHHCQNWPPSLTASVFFHRTAWSYVNTSICCHKLCHTSIYSTTTAIPPFNAAKPIFADWHKTHHYRCATGSRFKHSGILWNTERFLWLNHLRVNMFGRGLNVACSFIREILEGVGHGSEPPTTHPFSFYRWKWTSETVEEMTCLCNVYIQYLVKFTIFNLCSDWRSCKWINSWTEERTL